jgi:hypothetical protein
METGTLLRKYGIDLVVVAVLTGAWFLETRIYYAGLIYSVGPVILMPATILWSAFRPVHALRQLVSDETQLAEIALTPITVGKVLWNTLKRPLIWCAIVQLVPFAFIPNPYIILESSLFSAAAFADTAAHVATLKGRSRPWLRMMSWALWILFWYAIDLVPSHTFSTLMVIGYQFLSIVVIIGMPAIVILRTRTLLRNLLIFL